MRLLRQFVSLALLSSAGAAEPIRMVKDFSLSPDGRMLVFSWAGDVWSASTQGGNAMRLTYDAADDRQPCVAPDGREIAFTSNRSGSYQIFVMPTTGGAPEPLTHHTEGYDLEEYHPSGDHLLARGSRDHDWHGSTRFFLIDRRRRVADRMLFDDYGSRPRFSPDGRTVVFTREGTGTYRKGYRGSQATQIWSHDVGTSTFHELLRDDAGYRAPVWNADGSGFYYVGRQAGSFNLYSFDLATSTRRQLTRFDDDSVLWPAISRDGRTLVFRHLFDLYRLDPTQDAPPEKIDLSNPGEPRRDDWMRRTLTRADDAAWTDDGLEVAFIAGGDLWVMDTELKEPRQITDSVALEAEPTFDQKGDAILFTSARDGQPDIWRAQRKDPRRYWWQNEEFVLTRITANDAVEDDLKLSPKGDRLAFVRGRGDLVTVDASGGNETVIIESWNRPDYDWSPDGKWIVLAREDDDFNRDIWIVPVDGSRAPFNVSVHPDNDGDPVWSPDGKVIAFTGRRNDDEVDVYYVWLPLLENEKDSRDRRLEKALEKMEKERKKKEKGKGGARKPDEEAMSDDASEKEGKEKEEGEEKKDAENGETKKDEPVQVVIDFERLADRIHRISVPDSFERALYWIDDSTLAFSSSPRDDRGTYTVKFPDELTPKKLTGSSVSSARILRTAKQIGGFSSSLPSLMTAKGAVTTYAFSVRQQQPTRDRFRAAFEHAWRAIRDGFYDERLGNRDWNVIRDKYTEMAAASVDTAALSDVGNMMLGELNGSHLGFSIFGDGYAPPSDRTSNEATAHFGCRFDPSFTGPGWMVKDVIADTPAAQRDSRIEPGEVILRVDGMAVDPDLDPTLVLNGDPARDVELLVRGDDGVARTVSLRPTSFSSVRQRLYDVWIEENRRVIDERTDGKLGYLHIRGMNWPSFLKFEEELYKVGYGREGLIIDVRSNGGGSTTDHLLTALTQPEHAITVPRGGGPGYPQDRRVYATWSKPIVVMCDQNSFSNAEIFSHAIKSLGRGRLVGVPTAGGVISTGSSRVLDMGMVRMPFRGWYLLNDGQDMEQNGCVPHFVVWRRPGERAPADDPQLAKAIDVLLEDVNEFRRRPRPALKKASERG